MDKTGESEQLLADEHMKGGVCDFRTKFKYASYDEALAAIPDDPS